MLNFDKFVGWHFAVPAVGLVGRSNLCSNFSPTVEMGWELVMEAFYDATEPPEVQFQQPKYPSNHQQVMGSEGRQTERPHTWDTSEGPFVCNECRGIWTDQISERPPCDSATSGASISFRTWLELD